MGLDMYLNAKKSITDYEWANDKQKEEARRIKIAFPEMNDFIAHEVAFEVAYWRKANHIHKWFVDNVQNGTDDCEEYYVTKEQLCQLRDVCKSVIENNDNKYMLPTQEGFFFGNVEYNEYYLNEIKRTVEIINKILPLADSEYSIYYQSSW